MFILKTLQFIKVNPVREQSSLTPLERESLLTGLKSAAFSNGVNKE